MKYVKPALVAAAVVCTRVAARRARSRTAPGEKSAARWLTVTVNRAPTDVMPGGTLPEPLDRMADRLEARVRPAPGDRGTELAVRLKDAPSPVAASLPGRLAGKDPRQEVRTALREAKALLETGEVMLPDASPTTRDTPAGKAIDLVTRRSGGEGVL
ncbi:hypothetical protein RND61_24955 [Streptomyces sp. TRM76323]|uniref:Secreted protein n=1 Tax=Streptomyces tamarix TaxID=3078565 RepID=A0ABU3QRP7_9ACTN|nr:hypothetical protein [Streptomyces tamarix]MDT9685286.1 hypothetical protein [Streptomyces tamarix]